MSKVSKTPKAANPAPNTVVPKDDEWVDLENERFMWSASEGRVLQGYLLSIEHLSPKAGRPFDALVIRTTAQTSLVDRDGEEVLAPEGTDVLVPVTQRLQKLLAIAELVHDVYEVRIQCLRKVDIGGGQTMWTYKAQAKPMPIPRSAFGPAFMIATGEAPQLETSNGATDDIFPAA